jgi:intracellular sulfur oxidation DsrE/DsrF family protein
VNGDNPKQQTGALRNIQNHINAVDKENLDLRVVMHGHGVSMVLLPEALDEVKAFKHANASPQMQATIDGLRGQGVQFKVCANTLKGRKVNREQDLYMVEEADIVPSGVAELGVLQSQGFAYIKP